MQEEFHDDYYFGKGAENLNPEEKLNLLCSTWHGVILTEITGDVVSVDSVYELSLYPDGTWVFDGDLGFFKGYWTFKNEKQSGFFLTLYNDSPDRKFCQSSFGNFRHWGLQLYTSFPFLHKRRLAWNLTQISRLTN